MFNDQATLLVMEMLYNLWLATLVLSFSSSIILIHNYLKSRKTPIGRVALYTSVSSLIWSISIAIYTFPAIELLDYGLATFFLGIAFLAGIITMLGAYERAKIQSILTPSGKEKHESRILLALSVLVFVIALAGILSPIINSQLLNSVMGGTSILTVLGLIFISGSLIALTRSKTPKRLIYFLTGLTFIIAFIILFGFFAVNYYTPLDASLPGGGTTIETAKGLLLASLGVALTMRRGLKAWFVKITLAVGILFMVILDLVAYFIYHPVFMSNLVALCFILISIVQFWQTWKTR